MIATISNITQNYSEYKLFDYINFRALTALLISFFLCMITAKLTFKNIYKMIEKQNIDNNRNKIIPSMGGCIFFLPWLLTTIIFCKLNSPVIIILFAGIYFLITGFFMDFLKLKGKYRNPKLNIVFKIIAPIIFGLILSWLLLAKKIVFYKNSPAELHIPFIQNTITALSPFWYSIFIILVLILSINSFGSKNIEGVTAVPSMFIAINFAVFAYITGNINLQSKLLLPYIKNSAEITISLTALIGVLLAFLWFNSIPPQIHLGHTGQLMIAGILITSAIIIKHELLFFIVAGVFTWEFLLKILNKITRSNFKSTKLLLQIEEEQNFNTPFKHIIRYWILSFLFTLISLLSIKLK